MRKEGEEREEGRRRVQEVARRIRGQEVIRGEGEERSGGGKEERRRGEEKRIRGNLLKVQKIKNSNLFFLFIYYFFSQKDFPGEFFFAFEWLRI